MNLGIDASKSDQQVRGSTVMPHGTGKTLRVAVFTAGKNVELAKAAGADIVGMDDLAAQVKAGNINFDRVIASPDAMRVVGQLGQILGPRGLMPNPKVGTVTPDVATAVKNAKAGQVTYRVGEPKRLAALLNYTLAPNGQSYASDDPEKLPERVIHVINVLARAELQKLPLREAIRASDELVKAVKAGLVASEEITSLGLEVLGLSILAIKPTPETARALEAETRERLFREADEAIYARRNSAVEQERAIKENELNTEIAVETKKRQIRETQMDAERAVLEKRLQIQAQEMQGRIAHETENEALTELRAANARREADAKAYGMDALVKTVSGVDPKVLQALALGSAAPGAIIAAAFQELAQNAG